MRSTDIENGVAGEPYGSQSLQEAPAGQSTLPIREKVLASPSGSKLRSS